jgi:hypothetical protein
MFRLSTNLLGLVVLMALGCFTATSTLAQSSAAAAPLVVNRPPLAPPVPQFFRSDWTRTPQQHPVTQADLANQDLELKLYGPSGKQILTASAGAASMTGGAPPHIFTGMCEQTCAMAVREKKSFVDLSGLGRIRWSVKVSGPHRIHPIVKLADGTWLLGEHTDGNELDFNLSEFNLAEMRWIKLDIDRVVTRGQWLSASAVDFAKVDEVGFTDLMPGAGHGDGGFSDMGWMEVYGKPVPRVSR